MKTTSVFTNNNKDQSEWRICPRARVVYGDILSIYCGLSITYRIFIYILVTTIDHLYLFWYI